MVGVCLCCVSCLLVCVFSLLGKVCGECLVSSCMSVCGCISVKSSSVSCVNLSQSAFL